MYVRVYINNSIIMQRAYNFMLLINSFIVKLFLVHILRIALYRCGMVCLYSDCIRPAVNS